MTHQDFGPCQTRGGMVRAAVAEAAAGAVPAAVAEAAAGAAPEAGAVVAEAASFLVANVGMPVHLSDVADHVGYSPFYLAHCFTHHLGMPPGRFLASHRFQRAKELLLRGDERVVDVCFAAGFSSLGTFTTAFNKFVGSTPTEFRRLPHTLAASPPQPVLVPGPRPGGGVLNGTVRLSPAAAQALGNAPSIYVGLFPQRAARGLPVSGALLAGPGAFRLADLAPGTYFLLASGLASRADFHEQLLPSLSVVGAAAQPVVVSATATLHRRDVYIDTTPAWAAPVLVALPMLACPTAQDWRSRR